MNFKKIDTSFDTAFSVGLLRFPIHVHPNGVFLAIGSLGLAGHSSNDLCSSA